jgi:hypothetical protein
MADFAFGVTVDLDRADIISTPLGAAAGEAWASASDIGKGVKLGAEAGGNYVALADDDDIEGFILTVEAHTVNDGFKFGSVQRNGRVVVRNDATGVLAVGDLVVSAIPVAAGTSGKMKVKGGTPALFNWRVVSTLDGAGAINTDVLIERI